MIVIALGAGVMGWFLPAGSTFTKAAADLLYCSITSANCSSLYCTFAGGGGMGNCLSTTNDFCNVHNTSQKTTSQSFTTTSFVTYTHSAIWSDFTNAGCSPPGFGLGAFGCVSSFQYKVNSTQVLASFQLTDIGGTPQSGSSATFQAQEASATAFFPLNLDNSQASNTVPNADTNLKSYSLAANTYANVLTRAEGYINFTITSTAQAIALKLKYGSTVIGSRMVDDGAVALAQSIPFTIEGSGVQTGAVTVAVTDGAAAADANTKVVLNNLFVEANYAATTTQHIGSIVWRGVSSNAVSAADIALQAKVSGANMLVTITAGSIFCVSGASGTAVATQTGGGVG